MWLSLFQTFLSLVEGFWSSHRSISIRAYSFWIQGHFFRLKLFRTNPFPFGIKRKRFQIYSCRNRKLYFRSATNQYDETESRNIYFNKCRWPKRSKKCFSQDEYRRMIDRFLHKLFLEFRISNLKQSVSSNVDNASIFSRVFL